MSGGIPKVLKPQTLPDALEAPLQLVRGPLARWELVPLLDMIGDEFPQYANDLHEVALRAESDAAALIGRRT